MPVALSDSMCTRTSPSASSARAIAWPPSAIAPPTTATMPRFRSTRHVAERAQVARRSPRAAMASSTVSDTDTSDVATTSTDVRCRSNDLEDRPQKSLGEQHARRADLHERHACSCRRSRSPARCGASKVILRAVSLAAVSELSTYTGMPSRTAGAIVFGCSTFAPNDASSDASSNAICSIRRADRNDARIGGEHAVDVGPDLDRVGAHRGADERRAVVAPAAPERRGDARAFRRADEPAEHRNPAVAHERQHERARHASAIASALRLGAARTRRR